MLWFIMLLDVGLGGLTMLNENLPVGKEIN